ncbi:GDSL-type esterase/lipase family protein [Dyella sp.]|uniref:GDSL-type esterase/lipase family protein n=1 Tax=Dyella sp. TaxID=1869338 RepID=UPI002ED5B3F4
MNTRSFKRLLCVTLGLGAASVINTACAVDVLAPWVGTWGVAQLNYSTANYHGKTLREIVHTSMAGSAVRVQISNEFGDKPLSITDVHVALRDSGASIQPDTDRTLTFQGQPGITIPAGQRASSDGIDFNVPALSDISVSFYVDGDTNAVTGHSFSNQDKYVADGDVSGRTNLSAQTNGDYVFLANLDVQNTNAEGTLVTFGASITDGFDSSYNANKRWPNDLASRFASANQSVGIVNMGISGNNLLQDGSGQSGVHRFQRDVLAQPGVRWVIFSDDPINDLGSGNPDATFENLSQAIKGLIDQAHAQGIRFYCSTLTPFKGSSGWTADREVIREQLNDWVKSSASGCDGVIDQDTATHDPSAPTQYLPAYDAGDHLHPNDTGYQAIAGAVNLGLFTPPALPVIATPAGCGSIGAGEGLVPGQTVVSCDGGYVLNMQFDGNLVLYKRNGTPLWASNTVNQPAAQADLTDDGNLVVLGKLGNMLWQSQSGGQDAARLFVQGDGNTVIYNNAGPVWSTGTAGR